MLRVKVINIRNRDGTIPIVMRPLVGISCRIDTIEIGCNMNIWIGAINCHLSEEIENVEQRELGNGKEYFVITQDTVYELSSLN